MKRLHSSLAGLTALSLLLTACSSVPSRSGAGNDPAPAPTATNQVVTIKVANLGGPWIDSLISGFYEKYPNYRIERVNFQPQPGQDYREYMKQQISEGAVDVVSVGLQDQMVKDGLILPLEPFIQKSKFDLKPYGPAVDQIKNEGKLYGLPYTIMPQVLLYNADLFQAAGAPLPKEGWTWEDFRLAAAKIAKGDGEGKVWGFYHEIPDSLPSMYVQMKTGYTGPFPPADAMKDALQFFSTMIFSDKSMPKAVKQDYTGQSGNAIALDGSQDAFGQGKAGMVFENLFNFRYRMQQQTKFRADVAPMPTAASGQSVNYVYPQMMGITAGSKQPQGAWEFVMYAAGAQGAKFIAKQGQLPMYRTDEVKKAWFDQQPAPPAGTEFLFTTTFAVPTFDTTLANKKPIQEDQQKLQQMYGRLQNALNGALTGEKSVDDAIREYSQAQDEVRKLYQ